MSFTEVPSFPSDIPTYPLAVIDYERIVAGDKEEIESLWKAATGLGFWYLKNHGVEDEASEIFDVGTAVMDLSFDEKMRFGRQAGKSFGYKPIGASVVDELGTPDNVEFFNVSKDDALAYPTIIHRSYPSIVNAKMSSAVAPFVRKSLHVLDSFLSVFEQKLDLPTGSLLGLHPFSDFSGSEVRCIKSPPRNVEAADRDKALLHAHTDFGSMSFLHNRLGGLQVLPPGSQQWQFILPIPGHAICNIGDSLSLLSAGILRSSLHRTVPPPGEQGIHTRWSVAFFLRPGHNVKLHALEESNMVAEALSRMSIQNRAMYQQDVTQVEWFARRVENVATNNYKGPETFFASRGTEHRVSEVSAN